MSFLDQLLMEPRFSELLACDEQTLVVRVDVPSREADRLVPTLLCHRAGTDGSWTPAWSAPGMMAALGNSSSVAYVAPCPAGQEIRVRDSAGKDQLWHEAAGRVGALCFDRLSGVLACTVQETGPGAVQRPATLTHADAVWFDDQRASLGGARRMEGPWRVWLLRPKPSLLPLTLPTGAELTGEASWLEDGQLVLGAAYHLRDGRRRFGLLFLGTDGRLRREVLKDDVDLTAPVASPDGARLACLGTSVPAGDEHMVQYPCLITSEGAYSVLDSGDGLWQQPRGWAGPTRLLCLAEAGPRRRLIVHELARGTHRMVELEGSVLDIAGSGPRPAVLTSSLDVPPALKAVDLDSAVVSELLRSTALPIPGRLRRVDLNDPELADPLAAWVCEPHGESRAGLIALFHGGPLKSWTDWAWRWSPWPFVAAGFTVALIDPPMSLGYGDAAVAVGWRRWRTGIGAVAARQVRALQHLTGLQQAPLALMGGSFGGYLALVTATELRPRLIVAHGPPTDLRQVATVTDVGWQWIREYGDPDAQHQRYDEQSLPRAAVPAGTRVLLSHGINDDLVPAAESLRIHRSLLRHDVRSELVIFNREGHPLLRPSNLQAWFKWVLAACAEELLSRDSGQAGHDG